MRRTRTLLAAGATAILVVLVSAVVAIAVSPSAAGAAPQAKDFVGYWMGTDPLDGGDSRRGFTENANGTFSMIGRDSFISACGGTDRGKIVFTDGVASGATMSSDNLVVTCFNNSTVLTFKVDYLLLDDTILRETITTQADVLVTQILYFKVSQK